MEGTNRKKERKEKRHGEMMRLNSDERKEKQGNEWIENEGKGWC